MSGAPVMQMNDAYAYACVSSTGILGVTRLVCLCLWKGALGRIFECVGTREGC